uniref:Uncharacterized protein n=1 Tax=viral metagenome TaxID=1070528 RepID=A0A6H1ZJ02_9ZZZZ
MTENMRNITLFWFRKLWGAKNTKEKIRAMTALTAIENKKKEYVTVPQILDQAAADW